MTIFNMSNDRERSGCEAEDRLQADAHDSSKRRLLALAGAAVVASMSPAISVSAEENQMMIHMFAFRWHADATEEQKDRAIAEIRSLRGKIPGLLEVHVGKNISPRGAGYETGGVMKFKDAAALASYPVQPAHKALLAWLMPLIDPIEVDFPA